MKNLPRRAAIVVLLLLAAFAGLACALVPGFVEDAARRQLAGLPVALAGRGIALEQPQVEEVQFSLPSRELTLRNIRLQGALTGEGGASRGSFLSTAEELKTRLTMRGLLLATPLARFLLPDGAPGSELIPVADSLDARELTCAVAEPDLAMNLSATVAAANDVAVDGALLRVLLTGSPAASEPDALDWLYGFAVANFRITGLALAMDAPQSGESLSLSCAEFLTRGLERRHMAGQEARGLRCELPDGQAISIASLREEAIALPEKALLRPLLQELARPKLSEKRLQEALKTAFSGPEPLAGSCVLTGLVLPIADAPEGSDLRLQRAALTWRATKPLDQELAIEGFSMPTAPLTQAAGFALPGLSTLALDATLAVRGTGAGPSGPEQHSGTIAVRELCTVAYAFTLDPQGYGAELAALRGTYSGASLSYTDEGLLPRLAASFMPSAEAAMMVIKVGLARFCSGPAPENAALRTALETFVERPGSISLTARQPFTLLEAIVTVGEGNAGALVSAEATPGPLTLGQAMRQAGSGGR
ncbi:MAG: hypothetical protein HDQ90_01535 [Desulfovibrio sp.]|nr:hypothetical protein [Desulfovibrio sp.]